MQNTIQPPSEHIYLGWAQPPIETLSPWLIDRYSNKQALDLSGMILVLPAAAAIQNLLCSLIKYCQRHDLDFVPPQCVTLGSFPEMLYTPRAAAPNLLQSLLWANTAREFMQKGKLDALFPSPPPNADFIAWQSLGEKLSSVHTELAGELVDFQDVIDYCNQFEHHQESARWEILKQLQRGYLDAVDRLQLWDLQTARVIAVEREECTTDLQVVVAGCVDINNTVKAMLSMISSNLTIVTFAPHDEAKRFDDLGALIPEQWSELTCELNDKQIVFVESTEQQAIACAEMIANTTTPNMPLNDFAIALPDVDDLPSLQKLFGRHQTPLCCKQGLPVAFTPACVLLASVRDYLETYSYRSFATLLRHPELHDVLKSSGDATDLITLSDIFHEKFLPHHVDRLNRCNQEFVPLRTAKERLSELLEEFHPDTASVTFWCEHVLIFLNAVYGDTLVDSEDPADRALLDGTRAIAQVVNDLVDATTVFDAQSSATECIRLILTQLTDRSVVLPEEPYGVPVVGWLDISWLSHPNILVTSFNEGIIPSSITSDLFLPNSVREALGLVDNQRRYARDAYTTSLLLNTRENVLFLSKKYTLSGDPLWPSRLCLSGDYQPIAARLQQFSPESLHRPEYEIDYDVRSHPLDAVRIVQVPANPKIFAVTEFRDYLACPFRYYLKRVLRLSTVDDNSSELTPLTFGDVLHEVLLHFGQSSVKDSVVTSEIQQFFRDALKKIAERDYGNLSYPVIPIQLRQLQHRLDAFAQWQALRAREGWSIHECELDCSSGVPISDEYPELLVRGRIDRIDYHPKKNLWAIFDYKSSETGLTPKKVHNTSEPPGWIDLQLPLYRHLAKHLTDQSEVELGYINICNDISLIRHEIAKWTEIDLETADTVALDVMLAIQRGEFDIADNRSANLFSEYAYLLGDSALDGTLPVMTRGEP